MVSFYRSNKYEKLAARRQKEDDNEDNHDGGDDDCGGDQDASLSPSLSSSQRRRRPSSSRLLLQKVISFRTKEQQPNNDLDCSLLPTIPVDFNIDYDDDDDDDDDRADDDTNNQQQQLQKDGNDRENYMYKTQIQQQLHDVRMDMEKELIEIEKRMNDIIDVAKTQYNQNPTLTSSIIGSLVAMDQAKVLEWKLHQRQYIIRKLKDIEFNLLQHNGNLHDCSIIPWKQILIEHHNNNSTPINNDVHNDVDGILKYLLKHSMQKYTHYYTDDEIIEELKG